MTPPDSTQPVLPPGWRESDRFVPRTFVQPALAFFRLEASGGILMLIAAVVALVWANSPWGDTYFSIFEARVEIAFGAFQFHHLSELTVQEWINDAAMVIFFFVVGLEIKREVVVGDLRDPRAAALPAIAALGGMILPAGIYLLFTAGSDFSHGWGIPMATDIAFAVGVVSMVGRRVPVGAKLFLLALAIVDDVGAIAVIALVYTTELSAWWLLVAVVGLALVWAMNRAGIRAMPAYILTGTFIWLAVLESGVHATIAGVALALLTPVTSHYSPRKFAARANRLTDRIDEYLPDSDSMRDVGHHTTERVTALVTDLRRLATETVSPLDRIARNLAPWSSWLIVPLFALANAGVAIDGAAIGGFASNPVTMGVAVGLVLGKAVGVFGFTWAAVRTGLGRLPQATTWVHVAGLAMLAGIGFTVALFVATLAFPGQDAADAAKLGIFAGSLVAGLLGFAVLRWVAPAPTPGPDVARDPRPATRQTADH